jgi:hypothetical protein
MRFLHVAPDGAEPIILAFLLEPLPGGGRFGMFPGAEVFRVETSCPPAALADHPASCVLPVFDSVEGRNFDAKTLQT